MLFFISALLPSGSLVLRCSSAHWTTKYRVIMENERLWGLIQVIFGFLINFWLYIGISAVVIYLFFCLLRVAFMGRLGLGYQPWMDDDPDSTLITWDLKNPSSYQKYVKRLDDYLLKYSNITSTRICNGSDSNEDVIDFKTGKASDGDENGPVEVVYFSLTFFVLLIRIETNLSLCSHSFGSIFCRTHAHVEFRAFK